MQNKILAKLILGSCLCLSSSLSCADTTTNFIPYLYLGPELGWAHSDWSGFTNLDADNQGAVYGGKMGYQATHRFGFEAGGFSLPKSTQSFSGIPLGSINSWAGYGAATFRFPLFHNENLFLRGKAGVAYRNLEHEGVLYTDVGNGHYWTGILGASLNYELNFRYPLVFGVEYSNIFGSETFGHNEWVQNGQINPNAAPAAQIVTATLSVIFRV